MRGKPKGGCVVSFEGHKVELYRAKRFLTLTGEHLEDTPEAINRVPPAVIAELLGAKAKGNGVDQEWLGEIPSVSRGLRRRFDAALASDDRLRARWEGEPPGGSDTTRSAFDLSLSHFMRRAGFTLEEYAAIASVWEHGQRSDARHYSRCWAKAGEGVDDAEDEPGARDNAPEIIPAGGFVAGWAAPAYLIDGLLQLGRLYGLTALTGHGKTAVALCLSHHIAGCQQLDGRRVERGQVVYFAGENPEDVKARLILMADRLSLKLAELPLFFVEGAFDLSKWAEHIATKVVTIGGAQLIIVDTGPLFQAACGFSDENDNMQSIRFASQLRELTTLQGNPAVLTPTHPIKNAGQENLIPRGGSAFLNELDGNLTLWADGDRELTAMSWAGKFRGPTFDPITFKLEKGTCPTLVDAQGREIWSVWAHQVEESEAEQMEQRKHGDASKVLHAMLVKPGASIAELATALEWGHTTSGAPHKSRVARAIERLKVDSLVRKFRGRWTLTKEGEKEAGVCAAGGAAYRRNGDD